MNSDWKTYKIDALKNDKKGSIAIGPFGSRMKSNCYVEKGISVIRGTNLGDGKAFKGDFVYITEEKAKELGSSNVYKGDLVFPHRGSIGEVGIISDDKHYVISSSLMKLTCNEELVNPEYLYYFFKTREGRHELLKNASQVGTPGIGQPLTSLKGIDVRLPQKDVQDSIVQILNSLGNKIANNNLINQTFEDIAQAIFKSWFVDFEPVSAKNQASVNEKNTQLAAMMVISGKTEKEVHHLPSEKRKELAKIADLFPEKFVDSELGLIPEGWEIKSLYNTAEYVNGGAFKAKDFSELKEALPIIKIAELKSGIATQTKYTVKEMPEKYRINSNDMLYSWSGSPETSLDVFKWFGGEGWLNQHIFKINTHNIEQKVFVYFLLRYLKPKLIETAKNKQTTGLGHVTIADMKRIKVVVPNKTSNQLVTKILISLFEDASNCIKQNSVLSDHRDTLLPKLLSGELIINDII